MKVILPDGKVKTIHKLHYVDSTGHAYTIYRGRYVCETNNLFNINVILNNQESKFVYENSFYNYVYSNNMFNSKIIEYVKSIIKPDTTYTISANVAPYNQGYHGVFVYRGDTKQFIELIHNNQNNYTRISNTFKLTDEQLSAMTRFDVYYGNASKYSSWQNLQIEEGSTATPFKGYRHILFY